MKKTLLSTIIIAGLFQGCNNKPVFTPKEYMAYVASDKSGLNMAVNFNRISYKACLLTPEYMVLSNPDTRIGNRQELLKETAYHEDKLNFILVIGDESPETDIVKSSVFDAAIFSAIEEYANRGMARDIYLVHGRDSLRCSVLHMEPANSLQPVIRLSVGFEGVDVKKGNYTLVVDDNIFKNGPIKFYYDRKAFEKLPELKI